MNEEIRNDTRRTVTSVGNSWIVCKSKSHSGHVYYFNTLTGEAAWNLSDAEIEKAKSRTKQLEGVQGSEPTRCPEPKDKPPSIPSNKFNPARKLFVDDTVSAQHSSVLPFSNFANNSTICSPINQMSGVMQHHMINNPALVNPACNLNSLNNPMSTFNLNPTPIYNPQVWDVPHVQQIFLAPAMAPVVNQTPATCNVAYNNLSQTISQPGNVQKGTKHFYPRHYNYGQGGKKNIIKKKMYKNDLRQLLLPNRITMKPSCFSGVSGKKMIIRSNPRRNNISTHSASEVEGTKSNDDLTLDNIRLETQLHGGSSNLDLRPLKCLAPSDANADAWFIVVDLDVLLNEFKFLNTLTDSDEQCHLMVPRCVMAKLKTIISCKENIQARRIHRFLSQQIIVGYAFMAAEPSKLEGDSMAEEILTTCTELLKNKYHLILLSNDDEILTFKDSSMVNMFSIDEVKNLLMNNPNKQPVLPVPKKTFLLDQLINKIKITVPNDNARNIETTSPVNIEPVDIEDIPISQPTAKQNNTQDKKEDSIVLKRTVDAGIQTDIGDIDASNSTDKYDFSAISNSPQNKNIRQSVSDVFNVRDKKREIKLKRSTSNQPPTPAINSQKKQFKWRRRRNTTPQVDEGITSQNEQNTNPKNVESLQEETLNREIHKQLDKNSNDGPSTSGRNENKFLEESMESRESSIYADQRISTTKESVIIEETSTSGIISNSESNADAESQDSNCNVNQQQFVNTQFPNKSVMYEIDSITMGDYIKIKSDEWVSRFIQIMEEVLTQVLQHDPPFSHSAMPPPWTLHEATQCVAVKFSSHQDIKVAADKLSITLFHVSDAKGQITTNMSPYQYMQMYSYGLHLLVVIKKVTKNCEDIQVAIDSLNKLLDDIRNPNKDRSTNDTFNDIIHDDSSNNESSLLRSSANSDDDDICDDRTLHGQELDDNQKQEKYNFNSKRRKVGDEELPKPVKFIRNIDIKSSFFEELNLQRVNVNKSIIENNGEAKVLSNKEKRPTNFQTVEKVTDIDVPTNPPKIIRNFSICPELEEKFKRNYNSIVDDEEDLDYDEDYGEYITEEFFLDDEIYSEQCDDVDKTNFRTVTNENFESKTLKVFDSRLTNDNSKKFKYMMCMLFQEIRKALCQVQVLCDQCYEEFKNPEPSIDQKCLLRKMAERAHLHIICLCRSLESMLDHETDNPTQNMCNLLKQADINIYHVDERLLFKYRIFVAKCKEHADEFLSSIENIISTFDR